MLIDRVAAMAAIETKANADRLVSLADVRDALNSLEGIDPATLAPRWRDAKTDPPNRDETIIAFYESMRGTTSAIQIHMAWVEGYTHWLPLPEPPKVGEKE